MINHYWKLAVVALVSLVAISCEKNSYDLVAIKDTSVVTFSIENTDDKTISFSSTADWTLAYDADWFTVTPSSGVAGDNVTVTVSFTDQENNVARSSKVVITANQRTAEFHVRQDEIVYAEGIELQGTHYMLVGYTNKLTVAKTPTNGKLPAALTFASSNNEVAKVDDKGVVTAVALGEAVITATCGELTAQFQVNVVDTYVTDGANRTYTFADLAAIEYSGIVKQDGAYVITREWTLAETDILTLGDAKRVVFNNEVRMNVEGMLDLVASKQVVFEAAATAIPEPVLFGGDVEGAGVIKNVKFDGVTLRYFGAKALTIENCVFTGVTDSESCISLGGIGLVTVSECEFKENSYPAISGAANITTPLIFKNNNLYKNSATANNKPQINVTVAGDGVCQILNNKVVGPAENTTCGGIAVSNMVNLAGANKVEIIGNEVSDCRYGITLYGPMTGVINDNILKNNKYDSNPMSGGSGVSLYGVTGAQYVYMSGNHIEGHLWGITNIGYGLNGPQLNMGNLTEGENYNPGGNVFKDNGNGGVLYDLYNNCALDVMAQGNTWNVAVQDEASIEEVIVHKNDNSSYGTVTFMPAAK
jgi:parallel beta-helix repeat protein